MYGRASCKIAALPMSSSMAGGGYTGFSGNWARLFGGRRKNGHQGRSGRTWYSPAAMDILMVSAELGPYARASEAADAVASLGKALRQLGHEVTVAMPRYRSLEASG